MSENVQEEYDDDLRLELQGDLVVNDSPVEVQSPRRMDLLGITRTRAGESVVVVVGRQGLELYCWRLSNIEASTRKQYEIRRGKPPRRRQGEVLAPEWTIHGFQHGGITKLATSHGLSTIALTISTLGSISYVQTRNTSETPGHIIATTEVPDDLYIDVALDISGQRGYAVSASGILSIIDVRKNRIQALSGISAASVACHPSQAEIIVIGNKGSGGARILLLQQSGRTKSLPTFPEKIDTHCISWLDNESIFTGLLPDPQVFDQAQGAVLHISRSINKEKAASSIATYPDDLPDLESQACETHIYFSQSWPAWNCAIVAHSNSNDIKVLRRDDSYGVSWYVQEPYDESTLKAQTPAAISNDGDDIESNIAGLAIAPSLTNTNAALLLLLSSHGLLSCYDFFNIKDTEDSTNALPPNNQQVTNPATPTAPAQAKNALASLAQVLPSIDQGAALPQIDNSSSSGYPPMSAKPPTPFGLDSSAPAPAPAKTSSAYPPMSTKPPTPFGLDSSAPAPAPPKSSSGYPPMSTKPPTPFGLNPPAPAPAPAKTSSAYPPMSTKPPTPFGLDSSAPTPAKSSSAYPPMSAKPPTPFDSGPTTPAKNNIASKAPSSSSRPPLIPSKTPKETTIASKKHYDIDEGPAPTTEWERQRLQIKREFESTLKQMSEAVSSACDDVDSVRSEMQSLGQDTRSKLRSARSEMSGPNFERREQLARSRAVLLGHCEDLDRQCREVNSDLEVIRGFVLLEDEENISEKRTEAERRAIEAALHWRNVLESRELDAASRARLDRLEHKVKDVLSCALDVGQVASHRARLAKETKPSAAMYLAKSPRADVAVVMKRLDKIYELALAIQEKVVPDLTQRIGDIQKKSKRLNTPVENGTAEKDTTKKLQAAPPLTPYEDALSRLFESACSTLPSQPRDQRLSAKLAPSTTGKKVPSSRGSVKTSPSISLYNEELRGARNIALTSPLVPLAPAQEEETPISSGRFSSMISTPLRAFDLSAADDKATPKSFPSESKLAPRVEKTPLKPIKKASPIKPIETPTEGWFRKSQQVETKAVEPSRLNLKATSLFGAAALPTKDNAQGTALTSLPSALSGATSTTSPPLPATDVSFAKEESAGSTSLSRQDSFVASGSVSFFDQAKSASIDKPDYRSQVEAIYRQYAPEKFDKVNKILNDYAGREEILLKKLNAKYGGNNIVAQAGAPPAPAATTAPAPGMMITPNKLVAEKPLFPSTPLQSDTMRDDNTNQPVNPMFGTGVTPPRSTFGVQPSAFQQQVSPAFPQQQQPNNQAPNEDVRARIVEIYQKCNPEKLSSVDAILTKYAGRYDDLLRKLQAKYADQLGRPALQQAQQGNAFSGAFGAPTPLGGGGLPSALPFSGPPKPTAQPNIGGGFGVYSNMQPTFGSTMPGASPQQQQAQQSTFGAGFSSLSSALSGGGTSQFGGGNTSSFGAPQQQQPQPFGGGGFFSNSGGAQPQQSSFGGQQQGAFGGYTGAPMQQPAQFGNVSSFGITSPQQQQGISPFSGSSFTTFRG